MNHKPHSTFKDLIATIKKEDATVLLDIIDTINTDKINPYSIKKYIDSLPEEQVSQLTSNQKELLKVMPFKGGDAIRFYVYREELSPIIQSINSISSNIGYWQLSLDILQEDLIYVSSYYKNKWKQKNPTSTNRKVRGTDVALKIDMFSYNLFKQSIEKEFLRTEAKNLVLRVNKAYRGTNGAISHQKIRNKFYALILDNTPVHTKAMLNELIPTELDTNYNLEEDEALCIKLPWRGGDLMSFSTGDSMETYTDDTNLVTHTNGFEENTRFNYRLASAVSMLLTMHLKTGNKYYYQLAQRMAAKIDKDILSEVVEQTESVTNLNKILKETK